MLPPRVRNEARREGHGEEIPNLRGFLAGSGEQEPGRRRGWSAGVEVVHRRRREGDDVREPPGHFGCRGLIVAGSGDVEAHVKAKGHLHLLPFAGHSFASPS